MALWHFGNTTVRSGLRLKDALEVYAASPFVGNIRGGDDRINERNFHRLLGTQGIVSLSTGVGADETFSAGRKWRHALGKCGFIYEKYSTNSGVLQRQLGGVDMITPLGQRLLQAESVAAIQECYLRGLLANFIETDSGTIFSPLQFTLEVMTELKNRTGDSMIHFMEMGMVLIASTPDEEIRTIVDNILAFRERREASDNKRTFDASEKEKVPTLFGVVRNTPSDYADMNFRYLNATGLFVRGRRSLRFNPAKERLIELIIANYQIPETPMARAIELTNGAKLPTDQADQAQQVLDDLRAEAQERGVELPDYEVGNTAADINLVRFEIEEELLKREEINYARDQVNQWEEIAAYMELLWSGTRSITVGDDEVSIRKEERPAYFEWVLWRAFLAINHLANMPYEARRFKVDQSFLPMGTAPGGGADSIFVFEDYVIVGEVTLTTSTRQEAAEGEPVRRHVAQMVDEHPQKAVYGLFVANKIDSNTAETFRRGSWYRSDDSELILNIIPMTLKDFHSFFIQLFTEECNRTELMRELLDRCNAGREAHKAPAWKNFIHTNIQNTITELGSIN